MTECLNSNLYMYLHLLGTPLFVSDIHGGGKRDIQDLSRILEPPGKRTLQGEPLLLLPLPSPPLPAELHPTASSLLSPPIKGSFDN